MKKKLIAASVITGVALTLGSVSGALADDGRGGKEAGLMTVLNGLVGKGTLTASQVDAIKKELDAARASDKAEHDARHAAQLKVITSTLGITEADLTARLKAGETLATIAGAKKADLISALVAFHTKQIDEAVAAGKLSAAQATSMKANLKDHVTAEVERTKGPRKEGMMDRKDGKKGGMKGGMKGPGHGPRG